MKPSILISSVLCLTMLAAVPAWAGPYTGDDIAGYVNGDINPVFQAWATGVADYSPSEDIVTTYGNTGIFHTFANSSNILGELDGSIVTLGDLSASEIAAWQSDPVNNYGPGSITLSFDSGISNGDGDDFAVFENGFYSQQDGLLFAELGYVEVSTDGVNFARFDSVSLTEGLVGGYGTIDPTDVYNLAGKSKKNDGTGFDLQELVDNALVLSGLVDLANINYVKIVDIPGSGDFTDSMGNPIYDAWETWASGGMDLDAVGVINTAVPVPAAVWLLGSGLVGLAGLRRKRA